MFCELIYYTHSNMNNGKDDDIDFDNPFVLMPRSRQVSRYINNYNYNIQNVVRVSFEILNELMINLVYYNYYYYYFIIELSFEQSYLTFIETTAIHLTTEMFQSVFRFSKLYFDLSSMFLNFFEKKENSNSNCNCVYNFVYKKLICNIFGCNDSSNFEEWRSRHAIDMSTKVLSLIISFINSLLLLAIIGAKNFGLTNNTLNNAVNYCLISFIVDVFYFAFIFWFNNNVQLFRSNLKAFNVWKPFLSLYIKNKNIIRLMFVLSALFCQLLIFTQIL